MVYFARKSVKIYKKICVGYPLRIPDNVIIITLSMNELVDICDKWGRLTYKNSL